MFIFEFLLELFGEFLLEFSCHLICRCIQEFLQRTHGVI